MKWFKLLLVALCCMAYSGLVEANTLKDNPPTIFYPEGHYLEGWPRQATRDLFGYNYQKHNFNGYYANVYLGGDGLPPYCGNTPKYYEALVLYGFADSVADAETMMNEMDYWELRDVRLNMNWNDAWLSNQDRGDDALGIVPDGNLDRHYGFPAYFDSGAVLTQWQIQARQVECKGKTKTVYAYYYSKIVAVPSTAVKVDGIWYTEEGVEMGPSVYGSFAKVQTYLYEPPEDGSICNKGKPWWRDACGEGHPDQIQSKGYYGKKWL